MDSFERIDTALDGFLGDAALVGRPAFVARLVVEEAVRNVVEHGTGGTDPIRIELDCDDRWVGVTVVDDGDPFDPADAPPLDVDAPYEQRGHRGMGVHLMRELADELVYERAGGRNRLVARIDRLRTSA